LNPSPFTVNRALAIFHAVLPGPVPQNSLILAQIATLASLRLLHRAGSSSDALDPSSRYRINCTWDFVSTLGRSVGLEMRDYLAI
jgi:origin recognition complex subunit 5